MKRMLIQDVKTKKLKQMLRMKNFQDKDSQKMIKDLVKALKIVFENLRIKYAA